MDNNVIAVLGKLDIGDSEAVFSDFQEKWNEDFPETKPRFFVTYFHDDVQSNLLVKHFNYDVDILKYWCQSNDESLVDSIYSLKAAIDKPKCSSGMLLVPPKLFDQCRDIAHVLFPSAYQFKVKSCPYLEWDIVQLGAETNIQDHIVNYLSQIKTSDEIKFLQSSLVPSQFCHGYSLRYGGLSTFSDHASLNMCFSARKKDCKEVVNENRIRLAKAGKFSSSEFFVAKAVHGRDVWVYEKQQPNSYDGIVTNTPGVTVAAPGADCNMLLFADPATKSWGAAHAGWKGLLAGIIQAMVQAMIEEYGTKPKDLVVTVGPSLGVCCCEFGIEGSNQFLSIDKTCVVWKENHPKPFLDLRLAACILLVKEGVPKSNIDDGTSDGSDLATCTKCDPDRKLFSFRRDGPQFGNQVGFIGMK
ncbi:purine nucleoside phosphorylase LACC1-like [Ciona intestinalis]